MATMGLLSSSILGSMYMLPNIEEDKRPIVAIAKPRSKPFGKPSLLKLSPIIDAAQ